MYLLIPAFPSFRFRYDARCVLPAAVLPCFELSLSLPGALCTPLRHGAASPSRWHPPVSCLQLHVVLCVSVPLLCCPHAPVRRGTMMPMRCTPGPICVCVVCSPRMYCLLTTLYVLCLADSGWECVASLRRPAPLICLSTPVCRCLAPTWHCSLIAPLAPPMRCAGVVLRLAHILGSRRRPVTLPLPV